MRLIALSLLVVCWSIVLYKGIENSLTPLPREEAVDTLDVKQHTKLMMYRVEHKIMSLYTRDNKLFQEDVDRVLKKLIDSSNQVLDTNFYINQKQSDGIQHHSKR